jgi:hypothetical protein
MAIDRVIKAGDFAWYRDYGIYEKVEVVKVLAPEDVDEKREWKEEERKVFEGYVVKALVDGGGVRAGEEFTIWKVYPVGWSLRKGEGDRPARMCIWKEVADG